MVVAGGGRGAATRTFAAGTVFTVAPLVVAMTAFAVSLVVVAMTATVITIIHVVVRVVPVE